LATADPPDLMIIDGPPNCLGGREGVLYQAMQWARAGTLVLLDDANRREEQSAISCWKDTLGEAITVEYLSGFAKGLSAIVIHEPIPIASLWSRRLERSRAELRRLVSAEVPVILIDDNCFGTEFLTDRRIVPFLERGGLYWGAPRDSAHAIAELERMRDNGAGALALLWTSSWWRDYYAGFLEHVSANYSCWVQNDCLAVFDLRGALTTALRTT
jgi:hypothetical protein